MPCTQYKVLAFGPPVGIGATGANHVGISGIAKKATPTSPFIIANEVICSNIARALLLPCPPGALIEHGGEPYFFSLNFNLAGQALPPLPVPTVVAEQPRLCWSIIAFDVLVMNDDRHKANIAYDAPTKRVQIFDHSHALLGPGTDIDARLAAAKDQLAIAGHCLALEITSDDGMADAAKRTASLPDYLIEGLVQAACDVGIPAAKRMEFIDFMKHRRDGIEGLLNSKKASFPKLP